jgi:hypothetical protein
VLLASRAVFLRQIRTRGPSPDPATCVWAEFGSIARTAPGVGARHLNDYLGAIVPLLFVGVLGVAPVAAYAVLVALTAPWLVAAWAPPRSWW